MAVSASEYTRQLKALLPRGPAWPRDDTTSMLAFMIEVWALEFARVDARAQALINEADPRFCSETFNEWLTQWGIPDQCLSAWGSVLSDGLTEKILRQALLQKMTTSGSQSLQFFINLAKNYGYEITIDEFTTHTVMSNVMAAFINDDAEWSHMWKVCVFSGRGGQVSWHDALGTASEPLCWWGDAVIECVIRQYAPAHTQVLFGYFTEILE